MITVFFTLETIFVLLCLQQNRMLSIIVCLCKTSQGKENHMMKLKRSIRHLVKILGLSLDTNIIPSNDSVLVNLL